MKVPLSWLAEWVSIPWDATELAHRLTMAGFEVEGIAAAAPPFSGVIVASILGVERHPQSDKLRICSVSSGTGAQLQIVCGAANARAGLVTALATVGAVLPKDHAIGTAMLRGVESAGMLCSARELGLAEQSEGILELPADAPIGADLRRALDLDELILDINVTPNRGDAMSVLGIAREIAVLAGGMLKTPQVPAVDASHELRIPVELMPGAGAGRLCTRVLRGLDNSVAAPFGLRERLRRAGLRSISPVVDVTNYVLLEFGQPLHAYDRAQLRGGLTARRAAPQETIRLLDARDLVLAGDELLIVDDTGAVGLAGIMGGARTAISPASTEVVLESAWFDPIAIAGRARRFGLQTDASQRFERGVDPKGQERAIERATRLILDIAGGSAGPVTTTELAEQLPRQPSVPLRARQLTRLLGAPVAATDVETRLGALGMQLARSDAGWQVRAPSWRFDIAIEPDLIEEVVRVGGLQTIPERAALLPAVLRAPPSAEIDERSVMQSLVARGYWEVITFGFVDPALQAQLFGPQPVVMVANPIANDLAAMRTSLWPGLIGAARENLRRQQVRVRLFEIAHCFLAAGGAGGAVEQKRLAAIALGPRWPEQWGVAATAVDFFDVKADLQSLLALGGEPQQFVFEPAPIAGLHPGRSARIQRAGVDIGSIGELHPNLTRALDFTYAPILFEIDYNAALVGQVALFREVSRFPQIRRDISLTIPEHLPFGRIRERVSVAASSLLKELHIFDVYQGSGVESGRKSVALGLILQDLSRTLTDVDADILIGAVLRDLQTNLDARIRE